MTCLECDDTGLTMINVGEIDCGIDAHIEGYCDCEVGQKRMREEMCDNCGEMKKDCECNP
jgi:hypothetical protein